MHQERLHDEWITEAVPDRSQMFQYLILVRGPDDPERVRGKDADRTGWYHDLKKTSVEDWKTRILDHLVDGVPRTFNRICVELLNKTADTVFGDKNHVETALWALVEEGNVEYTWHIPVLFRAT